MAVRCPRQTPAIGRSPLALLLRMPHAGLCSVEVPCRLVSGSPNCGSFQVQSRRERAYTPRAGQAILEGRQMELRRGATVSRARASAKANAAAVIIALCLSAVAPVGYAYAQAYKAPRTADEKPDLNGIWEALNTANWDIQDHAAKMGPVAALGAAFSIPPGRGVVEGNEIPYLPEAAAKKKENAEKWLTSDPEIKCYLPGVPRAMYMPYPFQIVQTPLHILISYEFAGANRTIYMDRKLKSPNDTWMGWSTGHWEGDTLVGDGARFNDQTWFEKPGKFHNEPLHVIEP